MVKIYLQNELLELLGELYVSSARTEAGNVIEDEKEKEQYLRSSLERKGILSYDLSSRPMLAEGAEMILEACFMSDAKLICRKEYKGEEQKFTFYLKQDYIVLAEKKAGGITFLLLPAIKYAIGAVADLFWKDVTENKEERHLLTDEGNRKEIGVQGEAGSDLQYYVEFFGERIPEEEYREALKQKEADTIILEGAAKEGRLEFFMVVKLYHGSAYYYKQEKGKITYGKQGRGNLTSEMCHWMLYRHREIISKMLKGV